MKGYIILEKLHQQLDTKWYMDGVYVGDELLILMQHQDF